MKHNPIIFATAIASATIIASCEPVTPDTPDPIIVHDTLVVERALMPADAIGPLEADDINGKAFALEGSIEVSTYTFTRAEYTYTDTTRLAGQELRCFLDYTRDSTTEVSGRVYDMEDIWEMYNRSYDDPYVTRNHSIYVYYYNASRCNDYWGTPGRECFIWEDGENGFPKPAKKPQWFYYVEWIGHRNSTSTPEIYYSPSENLYYFWTGQDYYNTMADAEDESHYTSVRVYSLYPYPVDVAGIVAIWPKWGPSSSYWYWF